MGGAIDIVQSAVGLVGGVMGSEKSQQTNTSGQYAALKAEREAQEEQQRKQDAEERKHSREKITDARAVERKRQATQTGKTTLTGGVGLIEDPVVAAPKLKEKFGE